MPDRVPGPLRWHHISETIARYYSGPEVPKEHTMANVSSAASHGHKPPEKSQGAGNGKSPSPGKPGLASPIEHVVIIVKENHTFDNYFGTFPGAAGTTEPHAPDPEK